MTNIWMTCGTPTIEGMVNPITAACDHGFVPDEVRFIADETVLSDVEVARDHITSVIEAYGGEPTFDLTELAAESEFHSIIDYYRSGIEEANEDDEIAVDVTPGRKFMSAIAFQAGFRYDADHVYYFHRHGGAYYGEFYPTVPRTAATLVDFLEVF